LDLYCLLAHRLPRLDNNLHLRWVALQSSGRRAQAGVPDEIVFQTKPQIALDQLRAVRAAPIRRSRCQCITRS
jgi:hypothetical protein